MVYCWYVGSDVRGFPERVRDCRLERGLRRPTYTGVSVCVCVCVCVCDLTW